MADSAIDQILRQHYDQRMAGGPGLPAAQLVFGGGPARFNPLMAGGGGADAEVDRLMGAEAGAVNALAGRAQAKRGGNAIQEALAAARANKAFGEGVGALQAGIGQLGGGARMGWRARKQLEQVATGKSVPYGRLELAGMLGGAYSAIGAQQQRQQQRTRQMLAARGMTGGGVELGAMRRIGQSGATQRQSERGRIQREAREANFAAQQQAASQLAELSAQSSAAANPLRMQLAKMLGGRRFLAG